MSTDIPVNRITGSTNSVFGLRQNAISASASDAHGAGTPDVRFQGCTEAAERGTQTTCRGGRGDPSTTTFSAADERFGLRLGAGVVGMFAAAAAFVLLLLLVRSGWPPLRDLDANAAQAAQRIDGSHPGSSGPPRP